MSSLFTNYFGVQNAKNFEHFVTTQYGNTYITIGRNLDWPDENDPPSATNSANTFYDYWNNVIALKKVTASDINLVIPRVDWDSTGQTTYYAYTQDLDLFKKTDKEQIGYDYKFYVRNIKDQVFKCLANCTTSGLSSVPSTIMPEITIGGQLPENPYVETSDGYKWKYMYTIPPGLKQKFFTKQFMPVTSEPIVYNNAVDGRLDVFRILNKGSGYNNNQSASSLRIVKGINGDGSNANLSLQVTSTGLGGANVTEVNVISGGYGYTKADIVVYDPQKQFQEEDPAIISAIIGPPGGHGSDVIRELGASNLMISVDITGDENGVFPVGVTEIHGIRQIGLLMDPKLSDNITPADATTYRGTVKLTVTPPNTEFVHDQAVHIRNDAGLKIFTGVVEHFDPSTNYLYISGIYGTAESSKTIYGNTSPNDNGSISALVLNVEQSPLKRYSGKLLYIENTSEIRRTIDQTTQFKFVLRF